MAFSWSSAILVTDVGDGRAHLLRESEPHPLTGMRQVSVLCGQLISPAPLVVPVGPMCAGCVEAARATTARAVSGTPSLRRYVHIAARACRDHRAVARGER
jgi:hypothetical protein